MPMQFPPGKAAEAYEHTMSDKVLTQALERDGYVVVPGVLDDRGVERLRCAFDHAPVQPGGTQHIEITDETPEVESWRALEHHPVLKAAADYRNPLPGFGQHGYE